MKAIYDNPNTQRREMYRSGQVVDAATATLLNDRNARMNVAFGGKPGAELARLGEFKAGQFWGSRRALRQYRPVRSAAVKPWGIINNDT